MMDYYVYRYNRVDGSPYYIGKGKDSRAYRKHQHEINLPSDRSRIVLVKEEMSNKQACALEKSLIAQFGRKDLGTGILHNRTDGGDGGATTTSTVWITDGSKEKLIKKQENIPQGWRRGRCRSVFNDPDKQREFARRADFTQRSESMKKAWAEGKMDKRVLPKKRSPLSEEHKKSIGKRVVIDKIEYDTQSSAAVALGVSEGTICYWIKTGKATRHEG